MRMLKRLFSSAVIMLLLAINCWAFGNQEDQSETFHDVSNLSIQSDAWDVLVQKSNNENSIRVEYLNYNSNAYEILTEDHNGQLTIDTVFSGNLFQRRSETPQMVISVPDSIALSIETDNGNITIAERVSGTMNVETKHGNIHIQETQADITCVSTEGNITVRGHRGYLQARSSTGDIRIDNAQGNFILENTSGHIEIDNCNASIDASNYSGDIRLHSYQAFEHAKLHSETGDISMELLGEIENFSFLAQSQGSEIHVFNRQGTSQISIGSGPVSIRLSSVTGYIRVY